MLKGILSLLHQGFIINMIALILFTDVIYEVQVSDEVFIGIFLMITKLIDKSKFFEKIYTSKYQFKHFNIINFFSVTASIFLSILITKPQLSFYNSGFILFVLLVYVYFNIYSFYEKKEID